MVLVSFISFGIIFVLPGDPALAVLGDEGARQPQRYQQVRSDLGLDRPLPVQYGLWAMRLLQGDLGTSIHTKLPVFRLLADHLAPTVELTLLALSLAILVAIPAGVMSAARPNSKADVVATLFSMSGASIPVFWLGLLLILAFALKLRWLPPSGYVSPGQDLLSNLRLMVMPAMAVSAGVGALLMRQTRSAMLEVLSQEYITTARAKGLLERLVLSRHAFRNALIPIVTVIGAETGHLIGGAVVTETIFSIPGIGSLAATSIFTRDFPVLQSVVLLTAAAVVLANLFTDVAYAWLDPRIRYR